MHQIIWAEPNKKKTRSFKLFFAVKVQASKSDENWLLLSEYGHLETSKRIII